MIQNYTPIKLTQKTKKKVEQLNKAISCKLSIFFITLLHIYYTNFHPNLYLLYNFFFYFIAISPIAPPNLAHGQYIIFTNKIFIQQQKLPS